MRIRVVMCLTLEVFGIVVATDVIASYPEKPIRLVVGFVPGIGRYHCKRTRT